MEALSRLINALSVDDLDRLASELGAKSWVPFPDSPQERAFHSQADYTFFGGSAGCGKTDLLVGTALISHRKSIIFRREATQLRQVEDRALEILDTAGIDYRYAASPVKIFRLGNGKMLELGGVPHVKDLQKWQGRPHDFVGIDEATQFSFRMIQFLTGWLRTDIAGQRCRAIFASNPPETVDGRWVIRYFGPWLDRKHPRPGLPGELRYYAVDRNGREHELLSGDPVQILNEVLTPKSRTFIPGTVHDNPVYMETGYLAQLQTYEEPYRSLYLLGDFNAAVSDDPFQVIPTRWVEMAMDRWTETARPDGHCTAVGVDVARGGRDNTIYAPRWGVYIDTLQCHPGTKTPDGPTVVLLLADLIHDDRTFSCVDAIGVGASVVDQLKLAGKPFVALNSAEKSDAYDKTGRFPFVNKRAEWWWKMRERLDPDHGESVCLPPDRELLQELAAPTFEVQSNGIQIMSRDKIVEKIGRSPDKASAVVYSFAITETTLSHLFHLGTLESYQSPWVF